MGAIPTVPAEVVAGRVQRRIRPPEFNPHIAVLGNSGSGKDHFVRWLLETTRPAERTLVLDVKPGGDPVWNGWGQDVTDLPPTLAPTGPQQCRYRLIVQRGEDGRAAAERALEYAYEVRELTMVIADVGHITERRERGGMALGGAVTRAIGEGRSGSLSVVACSTSAAWAESGVKDQPAAFLFGQTTGAMADTFAKLGGLPAEARTALATLRPREFLYVDHADGDAALAITRAP